jgi:outer membrane protein TolC
MLDDYLTVLDAESTSTEVEGRLIRSETDVVITLISLYKAPGGGWRVFEDNLVLK